MPIDSTAWCIRCDHVWEYDGREVDIPDCPNCGAKADDEDGVCGFGPVYCDEDKECKLDA